MFLSQSTTIIFILELKCCGLVFFPPIFELIHFSLCFRCAFTKGQCDSPNISIAREGRC